MSLLAALALIGALLAVPGPATAQPGAPAPQAEPGLATGDEPVLAQNAETARIIVSLRNVGAADQVIAAAGPDADVVHVGEIVPYVVLEVPNNAVQDIATLPQAVSVEVDAAVPPTLASALRTIGAPALQAAGTNGAGTTVAILDSGIDADHPFFAGRIVSSYCSSHPTSDPSQQSLCPNGLTTDTNADIEGSAACVTAGLQVCSHGTHVAGIAAGSGAAPGSPGNGVAPGANIIPMQVFTMFTDPADCGAFGRPTPCVLTYGSDQLAALDHLAVLATDQPQWGITAANMSLGGGGTTTHCDLDPLKPAIDTLLTLGVATVISAGNSGFINGVGAPGCISTAVTVGATDNNDEVASFSNRGILLDLFAPGVGINSAVPDDAYASFNGTSMAAPMVAGALALARDADPNAPIEDLIDSLVATGEPIDHFTGTIVHTAPRIDLIAAINPSVLACDGRPVTVDLAAAQVPTAGADVILGTPGPDVINGLGGNDVICGLGGDDTINGGPGDDLILGGAGNDTIFGSDGNDTIRGGSGNDTIQGNAGNDGVYGGNGNDTLSGNDGDDTILGSAGNDTIFGAAGADLIEGGDGDDTILGGLGNDSINGRSGDDLISGNAGNDIISGWSGNDTIYGVDGADEINGGSSNDIILGGNDADTIDGSTGDDLISGNAGNDSIVGGAGSDTIYGVDGNDILDGQAGNDVILGGNGTDTILGGADDDLVSGNADNDSVLGGTGNDEVYGADGDDFLNGDAGTDTILGGPGSDQIFAIDGEADQVSGNAGGDVCQRDVGIDTVFDCELLLP